MKLKLKDFIIYWLIYTTGITAYFYLINKWSFEKSLIFSAVTGIFAYILSAYLSFLFKKSKMKNK